MNYLAIHKDEMDICIDAIQKYDEDKEMNMEIKDIHDRYFRDNSSESSDADPMFNFYDFDTRDFGSQTFCTDEPNLDLSILTSQDNENIQGAFDLLNDKISEKKRVRLVKNSYTKRYLVTDGNMYNGEIEISKGAVVTNFEICMYNIEKMIQEYYLKPCRFPRGISFRINEKQDEEKLCSMFCEAIYPYVAEWESN